MEKTIRKRRRVKPRAVNPKAIEQEKAAITTSEKEGGKTPPEAPKVSKKATRFGMMLALSVAGILFGIIGFVIYFLTLNMIIGAPAVIMGVVGAIAFKYYWDKGDNIITERHGKVPTEQVDCLNIYRDAVLFENWPVNGGSEPEGYLQKCLNDGKYYWVNFHEQTRSMAVPEELKPFVLPDQQFYDPTVFAEKVLDLPAHRRIFKRREKMGQVVRTALLVVAVGAVWILIITTTGGK